MSMLDSQPVFESRLKATGLEESHIQELINAGITSLGTLAFLTNCQPGIGDDKPLLDEIAKILKFTQQNPMPLPVASSIRRIWFEAHSVAMAEMKNKVERSEESHPRKLPLPERESRRRAQQAKLGIGVKVEGHLEPSNSLIDATFTMKEDETIKYLCPTMCTNRESEIHGIKKEVFVRVEASGALKAVQKEAKISADVGTEFKLRLALQRRSLSLDQLDLLDYTISEKYHDFLYTLITQPTPDTHQSITLSQLLDIDKQVWTQMALSCRAGISRRADGTSPMAEALAEAQLHPMVRCLMQPLPKSSSSLRYDHVRTEHKSNLRDPYPRNEYKPKGKGHGKGKGKGKSKSKFGDNRRPPPGLEGGKRNTSSGRAICFAYNLGGCPKARPGGSCDKGLHVCAGCESKEHNFGNCNAKN